MGWGVNYVTERLSSSYLLKLQLSSRTKMQTCITAVTILFFNQKVKETTLWSWTPNDINRVERSGSISWSWDSLLEPCSVRIGIVLLEDRNHFPRYLDYVGKISLDLAAVSSLNDEPCGVSHWRGMLQIIIQPTSKSGKFFMAGNHNCLAPLNTWWNCSRNKQWFQWSEIIFSITVTNGLQ